MKKPVTDGFFWLVLWSIIFQLLVLLILDRGKKYHAACVPVCISCLTIIINEKIVKDKAIVSSLVIFHQ